jgi:ABC-type branched-subunit amino acid transport system ATPase component
MTLAEAARQLERVGLQAHRDAAGSLPLSKQRLVVARALEARTRRSSLLDEPAGCATRRSRRWPTPGPRGEA